MSLKFTGKVCVIIMKNDARFKKEWICQFKIDMMNLTNFDPSTRKFQKFQWAAFDQSINFLGLESTERLYLTALKIDTKFEGKLICAFKNDMKNLTNFHQSTQKSQNWDFHGILLCQVENV